MDTPTERPVIDVMMVRCEWHRGENPNLLMRHPHAFVVVDIQSVENYQAMEYRVVALDPESQLRWNLWRAKHPEAA